MSLWTLLLWAALHGPTHGVAYHYHPYPSPLSMRRVAERRGIALDWAADGYASTSRCDRIGWYVLAVIAGRRVRVQQVDCSDPRDLAYQRRIGDVIEVDYSLAAAQGWATYGGGGSGHAPAVVLGYARVPGLPHPEETKR